jgi:hypothetical protein
MIIKMKNVNFLPVRFYHFRLSIPDLGPDSPKSLASDPDSKEKWLNKVHFLYATYFLLYIANLFSDRQMPRNTRLMTSSFRPVKTEPKFFNL